jgi:RNA polymerase sigma-70 factor (ECF subfamily)
MDREPDWRWWQEARAIARRHARGASDAADDLAQDLAVAALEGGAVAERPGAWLERVGRNAVIDDWRALRRRRELAGEVEPPGAVPDPEARVLARERRGLVRRAIAALPRPLRRAALARFHADLPFDAVASRLGTEPVTARTRVHRALERLRARVGGLRAVVAWFPGAQATALGLALVAGVARPVLLPGAVALADSAPAPIVVPHARRVAQASPAPTTAAPARAAPARATPRTARVEAPALPPVAVRRFDFDDDEVTGDLARPDADVIIANPATHHLSLIELREHFIPEMLKSLEDI